MGEQVSKRVDGGLTAELAGKDRWLSTELSAELCPFAVFHDRPIEVKHFLLDEPECNNSREWFRDRGDVVGRLGSSRNAVFKISVAQSQCENDLLISNNGDRQSRNVGSFAEGVETLDEGRNVW